MSEDREDRLVGLLSELIARIEDEGWGAVDDVCAREPELAPLLRGRVQWLRDSGMLSIAADAPPERLGDFKLIRRIASGGMGTVYEAEQVSLGRRVALKVIRPEMLYFPGSRERFRREIDAVARLSHPGIAAIHACGEEGALPYFAMELVGGGSLADVLHDLAGRFPRALTGGDLRRCIGGRARRPDAVQRDDAAASIFDGNWASACVRVIAEAARIVEYAHASGVRHRDLKPGNVLVTPAGRVVVVDFGLAALEGSGALTRTGALLGSVPYMAPEQLRGDAAAIGPRTDVYGLGATLYEMLALRRPFEGESATQVERAIQAGPPRPLREFDPTISRDLETVVACALEAEPHRRYATPGELAADLARALDRRPIAARRVGPLGRAHRWTRRHPARASAAAATALLVVATVTGWLAWRREAEGKEDTGELARTHLQVALEAIEVIADSGVAENSLERLISLLESAQAAYADFEKGGVDPEVLASERARLMRAQADLFEQIGRRADSEQAYRDSAEAAKRIAGLGMRPAWWRAQAADSLCLLGGVLQAQARWQEAFDAFEEARSLAEQGVSDPEHGEIARRALLATEVNRAQLLRIAGEADEARAGFGRATAMLEPIVARFPGDDHALDMYGMALAGLAGVEDRFGDRTLALEHWSRAIDFLERAHRLRPDAREYADNVGTVASHFGRALVYAGRLDEGDHRLAQARGVLMELVGRHPEFPDYRQRLVQALDSIAFAKKERGALEESLAYHREALEIGEELVARYPDTVAYLEDLPITLTNCALHELRMDRIADALAHFRRATETLDALGGEAAPGGAMAPRAIWTFAGHAEAALRSGDVAEAVRLLERSAALEIPDGGAWYEIGRLWALLARDHAEARASDGRAPDACAIAALRAALEHGWRHVDVLSAEEDWGALRERAEFLALLEAMR